MPKPYYNSTEAALLSGANNAIAIITPSPTTYNVPAATLAAYVTLTENYGDLLALATEPATRTKVVVSDKNVAKKLLKTASVNLAKTVTAVPTVTNAMLIALRMNERVVPTPVPVPATPPTIDILGCKGRLVSIHVHDAESERRGLPFGATQAAIYSFVGPTPPTDPRDFHYEGPTSRAKTKIQFPDSVASGATIWLSASWVSARGQRSVGSVPISFTLQGGALPAVA